MTITDITKQARVSRRVFYENFEGKEECFLAAFEVVVAHIRELARRRSRRARDWPQQAIAAARAVLAFLAAEPDLARLCLVESQAAGPAVAARFHDAVHAAFRLWSRAAPSAPPTASCPPTTEESTIGALVMLASRKVAAGEAAQLGGAPPRLRRVHPRAVPRGRGGHAPGSAAAPPPGLTAA